MKKKVLIYNTETGLSAFIRRNFAATADIVNCKTAEKTLHYDLSQFDLSIVKLNSIQDIPALIYVSSHIERNIVFIPEMLHAGSLQEDRITHLKMNKLNSEIIEVITKHIQA